MHSFISKNSLNCFCSSLSFSKWFSYSLPLLRSLSPIRLTLLLEMDWDDTLWEVAFVYDLSFSLFSKLVLIDSAYLIKEELMVLLDLLMCGLK